MRRFAGLLMVACAAWGCGGGQQSLDGKEGSDADASADALAVERSASDDGRDATAGDPLAETAADADASVLDLSAEPASEDADGSLDHVADVATEVVTDVAAPPVDSGPSDADASGEASAPVCGNRQVEPGEDCDYGNNGEFCSQCHTTCLGQCPWNRAPDTCAALSGDDRVSCLALLNCMATNLSSCVFVFGTGGPLPYTGQGCYCADPTCSSGAQGRCVAEFDAVAKSTDPAEIIRQLNDPSTTLAGVAQMAYRYGLSSFCLLGCHLAP